MWLLYLLHCVVTMQVMLTILCIFCYVINILLSGLYNFYGSATVDVGSDATFLCYGDGSYLYWFVDGVNTENMTAEEIEERGLSFSGYYNHYPPYYSGCDTQYSYMTIGGYCLNNNSEIYCVILGTAVYGSKSSSPVYFTVKGK